MTQISSLIVIVYQKVVFNTDLHPKITHFKKSITYSLSITDVLISKNPFLTSLWHRTENSSGAQLFIAVISGSFTFLYWLK